MRNGKKMEKWLRFTRFGDPIPDSPFLPFKVPMDRNNRCLPVRHRFTFQDVFNVYPNIGLVIDLTATTKYYDPSVVYQLGASHHKIMIQGHGTLPNMRAIQEFNRTVDQFIAYNPNKMIGVHCTHGINRTGYLICQYMINRFGISAHQAINLFRVGRHHPIERRNYVEALYRLDDDITERRRQYQGRPMDLQYQYQYQYPYHQQQFQQQPQQYQQQQVCRR